MSSGSAENRDYLRNFTSNIMTALEIDPKDFAHHTSVKGVIAGLRGRWTQVYNFLEFPPRKPPILGQVGACGVAEDIRIPLESNTLQTTMLEVAGEGWLAKCEGESGEKILRQLATAAVLAEMADTIWIKLHGSK